MPREDLILKMLAWLIRAEVDACRHRWLSAADMEEGLQLASYADVYTLPSLAETYPAPAPKEPDAT